MPSVRQQLLQRLGRFKKIVVWGLRTRYHTHRYIHHGFYRTLKKIGAPVVWTDYHPKNSNLVAAGDLVLSSCVQGKGVGQIYLPKVAGASYCLHNFPDADKGDIDPKWLLNLQVYTTPRAETADQKWDEVTFFDSRSRTLYQPWGTNLLAEEFRQPTFNRHRLVFWVGSIWDNALGQGNIREIAELRQALKNHGLKFLPLRFVPDWLNIALIRKSRLAPAIAGRWQVDNNYLPCRMFKNISYGQLGFSNVRKFESLFPDCLVPGQNIEQLVDAALALPKDKYLDVARRQQEVVKNQTYVQKLSNICQALDFIKHHN